jgi:hypothetical protein
MGRTLQGTSAFRLHHGQEIADVNIAIEFGLFFAGELALTG